MADTEKSAINGEEEEEEKLMEGMSVLDFEMLCASVALQAEKGLSCKENWENLDDDGGDIGGGGVQRMWEGDVLDCFEHRGIALQTACCPCYRFGKNMRRAGFGSCLVQGIIYLIFVVAAISNYLAYAISHERGFLYLAVLLTISSGTYLGFFRRLIRKQFNIGGSDGPLDDCVTHLICPCCTLCQESRTLEINNVQDGLWRGRGDTICIGRYKGFVELHAPPIQRASDVASGHSWSVDVNHIQPLVPSTKS
ncbi:hypothetical protein ACHQM5_003894 [Ranunculus cassubicifolius]